MSTNIILVLVSHRHRLLDLNSSNINVVIALILEASMLVLLMGGISLSTPLTRSVHEFESCYGGYTYR
jgi:hypothetical protein